MNKFQAFEDLIHPALVRSCLLAFENVVDSAEVMGATNYLEAAVLPGGLVHGNRGAGQQRVENAVLIPVAVVLVPRPGTANQGILHDHLGVVVVYLAPQ